MKMIWKPTQLFRCSSRLQRFWLRGKSESRRGRRTGRTGGPVAIHASARIEPAWRRIVDGEYLIPEAKYVIDALRKIGIKHHSELPRGCVIGISAIKDSYQFGRATPVPPKENGPVRTPAHLS